MSNKSLPGSILHAAGQALSGSLTDEVTVHIDATPEQVWALVSDVTRIGEFSPETLTARWTRGATGPEAGAYFKGQVKRNGVGPTYWTLCRVDVADEPRQFEFTVVVKDQAVNTWGYRIVPASSGVDVTEYFKLDPNPALRLYWLLLGWARGGTNREGMRTTLERIRAVVEAE